MRPIETVEVRARIEGDLIGVYVREGERVRAGQMLAQFEASEQEMKKDKEQEVGATPQGRKFFMAGLSDMAAQRFASAERNFKMALTYEPNNPNFKAKRDEAAKLVKTDMSVR